MPNDQSHVNPGTRESPAVTIAVTKRAISAAVSGGTAALAWSAPDGLSDGNTITVTTDGSGGYDFGANALRYIALGFGQGWLESADGTAFPQTIDSATSPGDQWTYERNPGGENWFVETFGGRKVMKYVRKDPDTLAIAASGGMINWDIGSNIPDNTDMMFSSWVWAEATENYPDGPQWKTWRTRQLINLSGTSNNSVYDKILPKSDGNGNIIFQKDRGETNLYGPTGTTTGLINTPHPIWDSTWYRQDYELNTGTIDTATGTALGRLWTLGAGRISGGRDSDVMLISSADANRWRFLQLEDYCRGVLNNDQVIRRCDMVWQYGTRARFEIADAATPETSTVSVILLPTAWSTTQATLNLWAGMLDGYTAKYLHHYDQAGLFKGAVAL